MTPPVDRWLVVKRGAVGRCPNCGERTLFQPGKLFGVNESCPNCGLKIQKGEGAFLGPFVVNYAVTAFGFIVPMIVIYAAGKVSGIVAIVTAGVAAFIVPLLLYRLSWSWWLMIYYYFLTDNLPANLGSRAEDDE